MSTGKRLAKRSILGTRIVAPGHDGRFYPAVIQAVKTYEDRLSENSYTVRFDNSRKVSEFLETDLIGPGFSCVNSLSCLLAGQRVYLTHLGREMEATIMSHDRENDQVVVNLASGLQLKVRLEDIRLLESRKSSRLMSQSSTDFSKLADFNIVHERKRLNSEKSSDGSEFLGSRKRRGSETLSEEEERSSGDETIRPNQRRGRRSGQRIRKEGRRRGEEAENLQNFPKMSLNQRTGSPIMTECTAAMVLMDLSGSPAGRVSHASGQSDASSGQMSPSSSGVSSLGTSWSCPSPTLTPPFPLPPMEGEDDPVEALLQLAQNGRESSHVITTVTGNVEPSESMESDEGIVSDQSNEFEDNKKRLKTEHVQTIYQCTWPGCDVRKELCDDIEGHVREQHLRRAAPANHEEDDREEEFYYTEIDIPLQLYQQPPQQLCNPPTVTENNISNLHQHTTHTTETLIIHNPPMLTATPAPLLSDHMDMARPPHENPEYGGRPILPASSPTFATIISPGTIQWSPECAPVCPNPDTTSVSLANQQAMHAVPIAIPITTFTIATSQHSPGKYIRLSPKPYSTSPKSPLRRPRGDAKKCRKVYGMEHRELWCTQCKWKKACTRFGEGA
eukprot:TRINITY_DN22465_c0_g1_i1.p1 TRINITY_DN22465_c0_g1~~TRINITY_DN22465_c0_g1_i1.p1  ORF type:complete len:617 (+),score=78.78 TRINITY_DN22465_c0_g1_i1:242-2092(+)